MKNELIINGRLDSWAKENARIEKLIGSEYGELLRQAYRTLDVPVLYQSRIHGNGHIERTMLLGAMIGVVGANQFTMVFDVVPSQCRAGSIGFLNVIAGLVGSTAPIVLGALSQRFGVHGFEIGFASFGTAALVAIAGLVSAMLFTFKSDLIKE